MKAVIQRVSECKVTVGSETVGSIADGFLILLGVENGDTEKDAEKLSAKISVLRIFTDENDKMNLSLQDIDGEVLAVSNFTLSADCRKGRRPNFINAEKPDRANELYEYFCECMLKNGIRNVEKGRFGEDMKVSLINDGPVTIIIDSRDLA